ncbi:2-polyprenyl-6-methoxyphenol hydroxylase-like FAD-dependent oxidoreductase [Paracoccus sulfuroxidans]|uniref:2-polyprenyl-6-methoxyphenol hydroxylase-like FAD-dependent oxidoreductase n=2 Tax=Paracoccus sulfuroxidans TaxID=384678 RepID=A0A562P0D0_9RHOB|nr:2-polyprenyl-6-methoxyphenol hydroxylase-like FAD-dependent oxidoreductase [Paracoccus sulfuroxidans]
MNPVHAEHGWVYMNSAPDLQAVWPVLSDAVPRTLASARAMRQAVRMGQKIAIAGAGIGGLATAVLAARDGHEVTVFDQFDAPRPVGSGLVIQPVGLAVLDLIGAGANARDWSSPIRRMQGHEARRGRVALDVSYPKDAPGRGIHRASLFESLWRQARAEGLTVVTSARVTSAPQDGRCRRVLLEDGRDFGPFDLIIDASGAGSALSPLRSRPLRFGAVWGTVPWPEQTAFCRERLRQCYLGANHMIGILPIGQRPDDPQPIAAVFWSLPQDRIAEWQVAPVEAWKRQAERLWPQMAPFLQTIRTTADMTPARYSHGTLIRPHAPGLVHLGDAAHRASPQLGQGANMALLDALALVTALRSGPEDALADFAHIRRWHVWIYQTMSAFLTPLYQSDSRVLPLLRDRLLAPVSGLPVVRGMLTRLVAGDLIPPLSGLRLP